MNDEQEKHMRQLAMQRRDELAADASKEIDELKRKYAWLIRHAWMCAAISKAKAAELLGCSLIDFDVEISKALKVLHEN